MGKGEKDKVEKAISGTYKKYKRRMKRVCCCGSVWIPIGLAFVIVGIILLVYFAQYWGDEAKWERNVAYTGVAFILIGFFVIVIGVGMCVVLCVMWQRLRGTDHTKGHGFRPPTYAQGSAPYPQQPVEPSAAPVRGAEAPLLPPEQPTAPPGDVSGVNVEISDHHKF